MQSLKVVMLELVYVATSLGIVKIQLHQTKQTNHWKNKSSFEGWGILNFTLQVYSFWSIYHYTICRSRWAYLKLEPITTSFFSCRAAAYTKKIWSRVNNWQMGLPSIRKSMGLFILFIRTEDVIWGSFGSFCWWNNPPQDGVICKKMEDLLRWSLFRWFRWYSNFVAAISKVSPRQGNGWFCNSE